MGNEIIEKFRASIDAAAELRTVADNLQNATTILDNHLNRMMYEVYQRLVVNVSIEKFGPFDKGKLKLLDASHEVTIHFNRKNARALAYELLAWAEKQPKEANNE